MNSIPINTISSLNGKVASTALLNEQFKEFKQKYYFFRGILYSVSSVVATAVLVAASWNYEQFVRLNSLVETHDQAISTQKVAQAIPPNQILEYEKKLSKLNEHVLYLEEKFKKEEDP